MLMALALIVGAAGMVGLYSAVTGQSPVDEVKAALGGGSNPGRTDEGEGEGAGWLEKAAALAGKTGAAGTSGMQPAFARKVSGLVYASLGRVTIVSGYRSREEQSRLYALWKAGKGNEAAPPGSSLHEKGLAVDFGGDLDLAAQLAPAFGLRASVPGEPWHYVDA